MGGEECFDFLKDLVASAPDLAPELEVCREPAVFGSLFASLCVFVLASSEPAAAVAATASIGASRGPAPPERDQVLDVLERKSCQ